VVKRSEAEDRYVACLESAKSQIAVCLPRLEDICTTAKLHVAKLVRMRMHTAQHLLRRDPHIKLVHLLRDPRGILNSRHTSPLSNTNKNRLKEVFVANRENATANNNRAFPRHNASTAPAITRHREVAMIEDAKVLCPTIVRDMQASRYVQQQHPQSILTLKYEDIAVDPVATIDRLYSFLQLDVPSLVKQWFNSTMRQGESRSGGSSTQKKDPAGIATKWRTAIGKDSMEEINRSCAEAVAMSGYTEL